MISKTLKLLALLALVFLIGWLLYESTTIILYVLFSAVVALIAKPIYQFLDKIKIKNRHLPDALKAALTIIIIFGGIGSIIGFFLPAVLAEAQLLTNIDIGKLREAMAPSVEWINNIAQRFHFGKSETEASPEIISYFVDTIDMSLIPNIFNTLIGALGNFMIALFSIAFITFFFIRDQNLLPRLVMRLTPRSLETGVNNILTNTRSTLSRYFIGLFIQMTAITLCIFIGLSILGVKNALLIAFFTGIVNLVPYLGPWIGASFGMFILVANNVDASFVDVIQPKMLGLIAVFGITQLLDNYLFQPTIFSNSINANPLEIFLVILVAGTIGGVGGMVAAIPVYSFIRITFIEMDREFGWLESIKSK